MAPVSRSTQNRIPDACPECHAPGFNPYPDNLPPAPYPGTYSLSIVCRACGYRSLYERETREVNMSRLGAADLIP